MTSTTPVPAGGVGAGAWAQAIFAGTPSNNPASAASNVGVGPDIRTRLFK
jgi:hypothetical protein